MRSFLGLCSYYRKFIKSFATIAKPLHRLSEKSQKFHWDQNCNEAFGTLKQLLTEAPILTYPDPQESFILDADASGTGIGAVLSQIQDGKEKVIAYYSRVLSKAERNYCVTRRELLAIKDALSHFHAYIYGVHIQIRTDHGSLRWLMNFKEPDGQLCRWSGIIGTYDFSITYRPGNVHRNADSLSRRPCGKCRYCEKVEFKNEEKLKDDNSCQLNVLQSGDSNWFKDRTSAENRELQQKDRNLAMLMDWKERNILPTWAEISKFNHELKCLWAQWDRINLIDGVLYRQWFESGTKTSIQQLLVPLSQRKEMFNGLHESISSGHLGIKKTIGKLRRRAYWVKYKLNVIDWCRKCAPCQKRKYPTKSMKAPMKQYQVGEPMERIAIDILGPLPESNAGNKYIMIVTDYFTRWTEAFALPNQEALTIARALVDEFISRFGLPRQIHTDQGTQFESKLFQNLCELLDIDKTRTTAFHPQSDGLVERFNKTLEDMISKYITVDQRSWDSSLQLLLMAYRTSEHESTGYTSNRMMFGREPLLAVDLLIGSVEGIKPTTSTASFVDDLSEHLQIIHEIARTNMSVASDRQKKNYDHRKNFHVYVEGESVFLFNPVRKKGVSPKLQSFWDGPFLVVQKLSDLVYKIQKSPTAKPRVVHHDRLKPCYEKLTSWLNVTNTNTQDENLVKRANNQPFISDDHPTDKDILPMPEVDIQPTLVKESCDHQSEKPAVDESLPPSTNVVKDVNVPSVTRSGRVTRKPKFVQQYYYTF